MEKGRPYSLRPQDPKRRLADDLARIGRDNADVVELLKRHRSRIPDLRRKAIKRLRTGQARERLRELVQRAGEELLRRRH